MSVAIVMLACELTAWLQMLALTTSDARRWQTQTAALPAALGSPADSPAGTAAPTLRLATTAPYGSAIGMGSFGTSVATETCGQVRLLKFRKTVCVYWSCVYVTSIWVFSVVSVTGVTSKLTTGPPAVVSL